MIKDPNVIVLPEPGGALRLFSRSRSIWRTLDAEDAAAWSDWAPSRLRAVDELAAAGMVQPVEPAAAERSPWDDLRLTPTPRWTKGYAESSDLTILFNTRSMPRNPLLALGPYGSLVWRGVTSEMPVGVIRGEAARVFGRDEVLPFARRLMDLGFIESAGIPQDGPESLIKMFEAPEVQFTLRQARLPWYCLWELATTCDLRCKICYLPQFKDPGPTRDEAMRIVDQIVDAGIFYVGLLGGEALLRADLEDIVAALRGNGIFVKIISNGVTLTRERAAKLAAADLNQIEISFDGLDAATHEASRGPGTWEKSIAALRNARDAGIPRLGMVLTLHAGNIDDVERLPSFMRAHDIADCYLSPFRKTGLLGGRSRYQPLHPATRHRVALAARGADTNIALLSECSCARTSIVIGANHELRLCTFESGRSAGNLREHTLADLWTSLADTANADGPLGFCRTAPAVPP